MRMATYGLNNIQAIDPKTKKYYYPAPRVLDSYRSFPETEGLLDAIIDVVDELIEYKEKKNLSIMEDGDKLVEEFQRLCRSVFTESFYEQLWQEKKEESSK